jgi:retinol dehydrogenase 12
MSVDVPDMTGRTVVVTGANSGIGLETAVALAGGGARVLATGRDPERLASAVEEIRRRATTDQVEGVVFDLGEMASVRAGAADLLDRAPRLDVLVNNAGLVLSQRRETADGLEATFAVNHLGPFLLTNLLVDRLRASAPARVVTVASTAHTSARNGLRWDDLQTRGRYQGMQVYARSKLANILFSRELARRLAGSGVTANCLHPGTVATGFARDGDASGVLAFGVKLIKPFVLTPARGAQTSIYLAASPEVADVSGEYFVKCRARTPSRAARDDEAARRLWDVSEELSGLRRSDAAA